MNTKHLLQAVLIRRAPHNSVVGSKLTVPLWVFLAALILALLLAGPSSPAHAEPPDSGFNPGANGDVTALAVQADGKIVVGGWFTTLGGQTRNYIGRLNPDGTLDTTFDPGANSIPYALAVQEDGKIVVGGAFTTLGGQTRNYIGRLNADGTLDTNFNPGASDAVRALALQADGKIVVGGYFFTTLGGQPRNYIGRLNADGSLDTNFNPDAQSIVHTLAVQADGKIVVGGRFITLGGQTRNRIGRLNADGTLDTTFDPGTNNVVNALALQADGKIVVGGGFTTLGGQTRTRIGRLNADGTLDTGFDPFTNGAVEALAVQADGKIVMGGYFTTLDTHTRNNLARLQVNGAADETFNPGTDSVVYALAVADGKIVVGGAFTTLGGQTRNHIGRLDVAIQPTISNIQPSGWWSIDQSPVVYASVIDTCCGINVTSAFFRYSVDDGLNWIGPFPASVSGSNGVTSTQTMTTTRVPFASDSGTNNRIEFSIANMRGNVGTAQGNILIDTVAPSSSASSPASTGSSSFLVIWPGLDAHSGVGAYDVQSRNMTTGGNWTNWLLNTASPSSTFSGQNGNIYQFQSRARDNAGNLEAYPVSYDTQTEVANIDVWVRNPGLEVNQAIQDLNNSVTLIAGKRTFVRAYVGSDAGTIASVAARLTVSRGASVMGTLSPSNPDGSISVLASPSRSDLNQSYYFDVPTGWLDAGSVTFNFEINPSPRKYAENDYTNNTRSATVSFVNSPTMNLLNFDVPYRFGGVVRNIRTLDRALLASWLRRAYPIKTLNASWAYLDPPYDSLPSASTVNGDLSWNKIRAIIYAGEDIWMRYYGMAIDTGGFMRGLAAGIPALVASGPTGPTGTGGWDTDGSYGDWYGGHELGHAYGRSHVLCSGDELGPDGSYPYPNGDISPNQTQWSSTSKYGVDAVGPTVIPPSWKDVMTYCANEWVSDFTYEAIYDRMIAEKPVSAAQIREMIASGGEHLAVIGSVITPTDQITLSTFYRLPNGFDVFGRDVNGEYHIRFLGAGDTQLVDYPFSPRFSPSSDEPVGMINEMVPWVSGTRKVVILHGATVLAVRNVSANTPTVTITFPNGGETLSASNVTVTWTASDADGDTLSYSLDYSRDGGATWEPQSANITATQATLDLSRLPGTTQGRFRVWASDGVNTTMDASDGNFTVAGKPPTIVSIAPASGKTYVVSQTVTLEGQAFDAEDGLLPDNRLEWSSNLMGPLGTGQLLQTTNLIIGTHAITLKAIDSNSNVAQATTTILVTDEKTSTPTGSRIFLPFLSRGP